MIKCAAIFTDHMVLLRNKRVCVWGQCDSDGLVTVSIDKIQVETEIIDGNWKVYLPEHKEGGPYVLSIIKDDETISFADVMYGEVFLAAGQSNMEMALIDSKDGQSEIEISDYDNVRYYNTYKTGYIDKDVEEIIRGNEWHKCIGSDSGAMSAVAYYAAKRLYEMLEIPIGIIDCYQGGTSISSWLPKEILEEYAAGQKIIDEYDALVGDKTDEEYDKEVEEYWKSWHEWDDRVRFVKDSNPNVSWEEICAYAGESPWPQPAGRKSVFRPSGCYYTMIKQIFPYTLSGVLYYQGETDAENPEYYYMLMEALIRDWRKNFENKELYFVITQLPMYIDKDAEDDYSWATIRADQLSIYENIRNVSLLSLADCGEYGNIHPTDKKTPGTRMGDLVLETYFNRDTMGKAMYPSEIYKDFDKIVIECNNTYGRIIVDDISDNDYVAEFEVAGLDGEFKKCGYSISEENIILQGDFVKSAMKVRYAWCNYGKVKIYNGAHIPLIPFGERSVC